MPMEGFQSAAVTKVRMSDIGSSPWPDPKHELPAVCCVLVEGFLIFLKGFRATAVTRWGKS